MSTPPPAQDFGPTRRPVIDMRGPRLVLPAPGPCDRCGSTEHLACRYQTGTRTLVVRYDYGSDELVCDDPATA